MAGRRGKKPTRGIGEISNPDKILYPGGRFTKAQVVDYYRRIAPYLLPHFKDRPVTLKRYPNGVFGEAFYEKDAPAFTPEWVRRTPVPRRDTTQPPIQYIVLDNVESLVWAANMACLELHPFLHRAPELSQPTHVVFDLDPGEGSDILLCCEVAFLLKETLAKLRLKSFAKVSGSKGLQVYVPLNTPVNYESTQPFARAVAELLAREHPDLVVSEMAKVLRHGKVFIDWSQNADHKTTIGVYSLRAKKERPYVSVPVRWEELKKAQVASDADRLYFLPEEVLARVKRVGDLFAPVLKLKQKLPEAFHRPPAKEGRAEQPRGKARSELADYEAKRNFAKTSEPPPLPRRSAQGSKRRFVVQKHAASHLHFDFRLELNGVLKSWAVPHGVPLDGGAANSAFATEDHPIEYLDFEGTIPKGQYGGGTVMVWDIGTYEILEGNYWKGALSVFLSGKKLKGEWRLTRQSEEGGKAKWLLTKTDAEASRIPKKQLDVSAVTGRTMDEIGADNSAVWQSNRATSTPSSKEPEIAERPARRKSKPRNAAAPPKAPEFVPPMKATLVDRLPAGDEWLYEVKWDGYRALALKHGDSVRLLSLKNRNLGSDFPGIVDGIKQLPVHTAVLDGEIVAVNDEGCPSFQMLQNRASLGRHWHIVYYAFDLLNVDGEDLRKRPLVERRARLQVLLKDQTLRYSAELAGNADAVLATVKDAGLEGIIAKRRDSIYQAGSRVTSWLKLKLENAQEFVVGGYNPDGKGSFQSLLVGYYEGKNLMFAGKVRQGFNKAARAAVLKQLEPLKSESCPFSNLPSSKKSHFGEGVIAEEMPKLVWLKPKLVAQCTFAEWTSYGLLRHGTFIGLRSDKDAREVVKEQPRRDGAGQSESKRP